MKKIALIFIVFLCVCTSVNAQFRRNGLIGGPSNSKKSILFSAGPAYLAGDIGGAKTKPKIGPLDLHLQDTRFMLAVGFRQQFYRTNFGYRALLQYANFVGDDANSRYAERGHYFQSNVLHFSFQPEYTFYEGTFANSNTFGFYVFAGAGVAKVFNKFTYKQGYLGGAELDNGAFAVYLPFGGGYEMQLSSKTKLGFELYSHYYFSDFIDGIKTKGSEYDDISVGLQITLTYQISGKRRGGECRCMWE